MENKFGNSFCVEAGNELYQRAPADYAWTQQQFSAEGCKKEGEDNNIDEDADEDDECW